MRIVKSCFTSRSSPEPFYEANGVLPTPIDAGSASPESKQRGRMSIWSDDLQGLLVLGVVQMERVVRLASMRYANWTKFQ